jgi:hypothetical protein
MRMTDPQETKRGYTYAGLKNIILSPELLVAYSGNAELAQHTISKLKDELLDGLEGGLLASAEAAQAGPGQVDYLLASPAFGFRKITARNIEEFDTAAWLGDADAFSIYQETFHAELWPSGYIQQGPPLTPKQEAEDKAMEPFERLARARSAVERANLPSVGEAFITADSRDGFRYFPSMTTYLEEQEITSTPSPLHVASVQAGGFALRIMPAQTPGAAAVGIYFPHGQYGVLYSPLVRDDPVQYRRVSEAEFCAAVTEDFDLEIGFN